MERNMAHLRIIVPVLVPGLGQLNTGDEITGDDASASRDWLIANGHAVDLDDDGEVVVPPVVVERQNVREAETRPTPVGPTATGLRAVTDQIESELEANGVARLDDDVNVSHEDAEKAARLVERIKAELGDGKLRIEAIAEALDVPKERLIPLLVEKNGFFKNQQGWYGVRVPSRPE